MEENREIGNTSEVTSVCIGIEDQNKLLAKQILEKVSHVPSSSCSIHKVPVQFLIDGDNTYMPRFIAVGPLHHGRENLGDAEKYKAFYMNSLISRGVSTHLTDFVNIIREIEVICRECYADLISLTSDEFVEMMILDGCFILELLYKYREEESNMESKDHLFKTTWILPCLRRDLVLLENQIPFIVLDKLYNLSKCPTQPLSLTELILDFFDPILPTILVSQAKCTIEGKHILDLLRNYLLHSTQTVDILDRSISEDKAFLNDCNHSLVIDLGDNPMWEDTNCATELQEAGVEFKRKDNAHCLLDITFTRDGKFEIPPFFFGESWAVLFPNLVALEQCRRDYPDIITSYVILVNKLLNSRNDVKLLRSKGIIDGFSRKDENIVRIIGDLCKEVVVDNFYYDGLCNRVNAYCGRDWTKWRSTFKRNYFRSPWVVVSLVAAVILLGLTFTQTLFTIFSN